MKRLITGIVTLTTLAVGFWGCKIFHGRLTAVPTT